MFAITCIITAILCCPVGSVMAGEKEIIAQFVDESPTWPADLGDKPDFSEYHGKNIHIEMWFHDPLYVRFFTITAQEFEKLYPEINFSWTITQLPDPWDKLVVSLVSGRGAPDISGIEISQWGKFWKGPYQHMMPLPVREEGLYEKYIEDRMVAYTGPDGEVYGLPSDCPVVVYYYRQDVFDELGIHAPIETWDDFIEAGKKVRSTGRYMIGFGDNTMDPFWHLLLPRGGGYFDEQGNPIVNNEKGIETLQFMVDLVQEHGIAKVTQSSAGDVAGHAPWKTGEIVSLTGATWHPDYIMKIYYPELSGRWRAQPMPVGDPSHARAGSQGGTGMCITNQCEYPDLAWAYLKYSYGSYENQIKRWLSVHYLPSFKDAIFDPAVLEYEDPYFGNQRTGQLYAELAAEVPPFTIGRDWTALITAVNDRINEAYSGKMEPKEFLDWVVSRTR